MSRREAGDYRLNTLGMVMQPGSLQPGARAIASASVKLMMGGKRAAHQRIEPLLCELGLGDRLHHRTEQLSMGERQRVLIALALSRSPKLVLADEPTASLDTDTTQHVLGLLREVCNERKRSAVDRHARPRSRRLRRSHARTARRAPRGAPRGPRAGRGAGHPGSAVISLSGIRYIYEARLVTRAVVIQEAFAVLGIAVGVALLFASQVSAHLARQGGLAAQRAAGRLRAGAATGAQLPGRP